MWLSNPLYMNDMQEMRAGTSLAFCRTVFCDCGACCAACSRHGRCRSEKVATTRINLGPELAIASILGLTERAAIEGLPDPPAKSKAAPTKRSAKSYGVATLPIGTRRGLPHHSATAKQ
jgi:hypothetical protein